MYPATSLNCRLWIDLHQLGARPNERGFAMNSEVVLVYDNVIGSFNSDL
jgi:hypothetical protein